MHHDRNAQRLADLAYFSDWGRSGARNRKAWKRHAHKAERHATIERPRFMLDIDVDTTVTEIAENDELYASQILPTRDDLCDPWCEDCRRIWGDAAVDRVFAASWSC